MSIKSSMILTFALLLLVLDVEALQAESDSMNVTGKRVRITAPSVIPQPITGKIKELNSFLFLTLDDFNVIQIRRDAITKFEISQGNRRRYIYFGALGGTLAGIGIGLVGASTCDNQVGFDKLGCELNWILVAAPVGLIVGTVIGILVSGERWETVDLSRLQGRLGPIGRGLVGAQLTFSF